MKHETTERYQIKMWLFSGNVQRFVSKDKIVKNREDEVPSFGIFKGFFSPGFVKFFY